MPGARKRSRSSPPLHPIDMTPLTDLGFLLITFFLFTLRLSTPSTLYLAVPKDGKPQPAAASASITLLGLPGDRIGFYAGEPAVAFSSGNLSTVPLSGPGGLRELIQAKRRELQRHPSGKFGPDDLVVLIKPGPYNSYRFVIDLLDEMTIGRVTRYALLAPDAAERNWIHSMAYQRR